MTAQLFRIVALSLVLLVSSVALAQTGGLGGTWKAVVLKKKDEKTSLTKDGYSLVITIDDKTRHWHATAKTQGGAEQKVDGTYSIDGQHLVFAAKGGRQHALRVRVDGRQLVISPKDDPDIRLVALRVQ